MKKWSRTVLIGILSITFLTACGVGDKESEVKNEEVSLGVVGDDTRVWDDVKDRLKDKGVDLNIVKFSDYNQPNQALAEGEIDLNAFQHQAFLENFNKESNEKLTSIGNTVIAPLGAYSEKIDNLDDLPENGTIAIPNDVTNGGRALILLESAGLIEVDDEAGITPTVNDITEYHKKFNIKEVDASTTARSLSDVDASVINSGYAVEAGLKPDDAIFQEPVDENSKPYVNIIVARPDETDNDLFKKVVDEYQTEETEKLIKEYSDDADVAAWKEFGKN